MGDVAFVRQEDAARNFINVRVCDDQAFEVVSRSVEVDGRLRLDMHCGKNAWVVWLAFGEKLEIHINLGALNVRCLRLRRLHDGFAEWQQE